MRRARFAPQARTDVLDIARHVASETGVERALKVVDRLEAVCHWLATRPAVGRPREELEPGLRSFPLWPYVIIYRPRRVGIDVIRVLHGARDIPALF